MRRAKIVCTLGPATDTLEKVTQLVEAGADVFRLNMSHGDYADHARRLQIVREAGRACNRTVAVFADLQGPKIRLGRFADGPCILEDGVEFTITTDDCPGDVHRVSTTLKTLPEDVKVGDTILVDDGKIQLTATAVSDTDVTTQVVVGGPVSNNKGINLPGVAVSVPALSEKDTDDLRWALRNGVDMIALSFVRSAEDIDAVHAVMSEEGRTLPVIGKLEKPQALENLEAIIDAFDAFMVARGDLGVELPPEQVPAAQKEIINAARRWAKPVIVATQMLESMISSPRPTRAETSDVANAVLDGTDAVMLSGETAVGKYAVEAVKIMARIIEATEEHGLEHISRINWDPHTVGGVIAKAAAEVAERVGARYLVGFSRSGDTVRRLSRLRSRIPVIAFTPDEEVSRDLALIWGVRTFVTPVWDTVDQAVRQVEATMTGSSLVESGDRIVIVSGTTSSTTGTTNALRVHSIP